MNSDYRPSEVEQLRIEVAILRKKHKILVSALNKVAYEPIGDAEDSHKEVLDAVVRIAKETLDKIKCE